MCVYFSAIFAFMSADRPNWHGDYYRRGNPLEERFAAARLDSSYFGRNDHTSSQTHERYVDHHWVVDQSGERIEGNSHNIAHEKLHAAEIDYRQFYSSWLTASSINSAGMTITGGWFDEHLRLSRLIRILRGSVLSTISTSNSESRECKAALRKHEECFDDYVDR